MDKTKKDTLKKLSKAIRILANIAKVICIIGAVCVAICAIVVPIALRNIKYEDNKIIVFNQGVVNVTESEKGILLDIVGSPAIEVTDPLEIAKVKDFLQSVNDNKTMMIVFGELAVISVIAVIVVICITLTHLAKLFKNIETEDSPFTLDNAVHLRKMAYLTIVLIVLPPLSSVFLDMAFKTNTELNLNLTNVVEALVLFASSLIFEYGYSLEQNKLKKEGE